MTTPTYVRAVTLAKINVAREHLGQDPLSGLPKGRTGNAQSCVIARGLEGKGYKISVGQDGTTFSDFSRPGLADSLSAVAQAWGVEFTSTSTVGGQLATASLPNAPEMSEFVKNFDSGAYPDLVTS